MTDTSTRHAWRFFRAGGFDQVRIDSGADIAHIDELDQKLWVALACPTTGLEFDKKTLDLIDTDKDGRIRPPELIAACKWAVAMLKNPDDLVKSSAALPLAAINDATVEGKSILASAKQILANLGKTDSAITVDDTTDTAKIFAATKFNGDGIIPADSSDDPAIQKTIADIIACTTALTDRSGKPGISQAQLDLFLAEAAAFDAWHKQAESDSAVMSLGANTSAAAGAFTAIKAKVDDFFARCRLAAYDARAIGALNRQEAEYLAIAAKDLTITAAEVSGFPLAKVEAGRALPLVDGLNPAWSAAIAALRDTVVKPLLGDKTALTEAEWLTICAKLAPYQAWAAAKAGASVEKLGLPRVREILASNAKAAIMDLLAKDKALEPEATAIAAVDKLARYHRDLYKLLVNFVNFKDFYARKDKAVFQCGRLYLDQRSCDLVIRVEDAGRHGTMAHLSYNYLAYCDVVRKSTGEKMAVAAAFTAGDSDNLMVGRNGIFYDRKGNDWDATITKIIDMPISIRQAFWSPYKRLVRFIEDQIAKRAAAAEAANQSKLQSGTTAQLDAAVAAKPPEPKKLDVGIIAALGVALGFLSTAVATIMAYLFSIPFYYIPFIILALMLLISLPSMVLAWLKLRQRNLGPILDANGWAVNAKAKINLPFGRSLTQTATLPPGSTRDLVDPYAESHKGRNLTIAAVIVAIVAGCMWYFGCIEHYLPDRLPKSGYVIRKQEAEKKAAEEAAKKAAATQAAATQATTAPH